MFWLQRGERPGLGDGAVRDHDRPVPDHSGCTATRIGEHMGAAHDDRLGHHLPPNLARPPARAGSLCDGFLLFPDCEGDLAPKYSGRHPMVERRSPAFQARYRRRRHRNRNATAVGREYTTLDNPSRRKPGPCLACGAETEGVEPDAKQYACEGCGEPAVYGAAEILIAIARSGGTARALCPVVSGTAPACSSPRWSKSKLPAGPPRCRGHPTGPS